MNRQVIFRKRKLQAVPLRFSDDPGSQLIKSLAKLEGILQPGAGFDRPVGTPVFKKKWPALITQSSRRFGQECSCKFEPFAEQDARLEFQLIGNQLQKSGKVGPA